MQSTPIDPYYEAGYNVLFDMVLLLYWLYLLAGTSRRLAKAACGPGGDGGIAQRLLGALWSYWRLLDLATTLSLICTMGTWWHAVGLLQSIRSFIDNAAPSGPSAFSGGPSPLAQDLDGVHAAFSSFKMSAIVTVRRQVVGGGGDGC